MFWVLGLWLSLLAVAGKLATCSSARAASCLASFVFGNWGLDSLLCVLDFFWTQI
uniref:Uncharacterized protein n=1 Tax=Arundo donax TaxID=35708 RepID=A0A0A8ZCD4_ARUDO